MSETTPKVANVKRHAGIAGRYSVTAAVQYPGESAETVTFVGSVHGGPIVMVTDHGQTFVSESVTARLGSKLTEQWVREFFAPREED